MTDQKVVHIVPDISLTIPSSRLRCSCGWEEKCEARVDEVVAKNHLVYKHNGGRIQRHRDGSSRPTEKLTLYTGE